MTPEDFEKKKADEYFKSKFLTHEGSESTGTAGSIDGWFGLTSKEAAELNNISKLQVKQTTQRQLERYLFLVRKSIRLYMDSLKESQ